ncbi:MAG: colanic acid biosynthesis protein [Syntrophus sp. PtaB.Bin001]|nr:MAG: colanic acid biosynthesis protein [Syntrophus sp. PtaB.Bin001]
MLIEIKGAGFSNKGAELMLHAVLQAVKPAISEVSFAMAPRYGQPSYDSRARLGLLQKVSFNRHGIRWDFVGKIIPRKIREMYGMVLDNEIDVVLDVSGYAYGDTFGEHKTILMARQTEAWKRQGKKIILLPQAMGPFSSNRIKEALKILVENTDLIFARDHISYANITDVVGPPGNVKIAPDFTNLVQGAVPEGWDEEKHRVCIIPSHQMTDKTSKAEVVHYLLFLVRCVKHLTKKGILPFILIHGGGKDLPLANQLREETTSEIEIVTEQNPLLIKGILGKCNLVIASRFHALVSALSQGAPCIGAGWSHKYEALFEDYDCPELLIPIDREVERKIGDIIDAVLEPAGREVIGNKLRAAGQIQRERAALMWNEVLNIISPGSTRRQ